MPLLLLAVSITVTLAASWDYDKNGPGKWGGTCSSGKKQSPINLTPADATLDCTTRAIDFEEYDTPLTKYTLENNGYTVKVSVEESNKAQYHISGGGLPSRYRLVQFHFHWGLAAGTPWYGSEHTMTGASYPLELHLVHVKDNYTDITAEALADPTGLAVIGVLFYEVPEPTAKTKQIDHLIEIVAEVIEPQKTETGTPIELSGLLPFDRSSFYRYEGSLTTPPCSEAVIWTVFTDPVPISSKQLQHFRALKNEDEKNIYNYRPAQPLNGREVQRGQKHTRHKKQLQVTLVVNECLVSRPIADSTAALGAFAFTIVVATMLIA